MAAAIAELGEHGYSETPVERIVKTAGVSRKTFYDLFEDRLDCALAAYDEVIERLVAEAEASCRREGEWPARVADALERVLRHLAADPPAARLALVGIPGAGPLAVRHMHRAILSFSPFFEPGYALSEHGSRLSPHLATTAVGTAVALMAGEVRAERIETLPEIRDDVVFAVLTPFLGPEWAESVAAANHS